jgi:geranylgeranyl reductase family protein
VYDAIVAGAGPAGSTAARELATRGASVLLVEKARFPRDKPCGGGVTLRAARLLPFDLAPVTERTVHGVRFSLKMGRGFTRRYAGPVTFLTQRRDLDTYLVARAEQAGATFRDGDPLLDVVEERGAVAVRTRTGWQRGRVLLGADGANGVVARLTGLTGARDSAVALEGNVPISSLPHAWRDLLALDLGGVPGGYGWLFPKGDHVNVGVGGWDYLAGGFRAHIARLCAFYGVDAARLYNLRGHHLPVRRRAAPLARGGVALLGDAAGLVDPLSGEGIYGAILSGREAAKAAAALIDGGAPSLLSYAETIEQGLQNDIDVSRRFQDLFYLLPDVYLAVLARSGRIWTLLAQLIRGERSYAGFHRALGPLGTTVDALALLTRHTPLRAAAGIPSK